MLFWKWPSVFCAALCAAACTTSEPSIHELSEAVEASVVETEVRIGSQAVKYLDPEFTAAGQVTFVDANDNGVWLGSIDPLTGGLAPVSGQAQRLGTTLKVLLNGPEFGQRAGTSGIYWIDKDAAGVKQAVGFENGVTRQISQSPKDLFGVLPTVSTTDSKTCFLTGFTLPGGGVEGKYFCNDAPSQLLSFPFAAFGSSFARWVPGQRDIITNMVDAAGNIQIALFNIDTRTLTQLSTDAGDKQDAFFFRAPEYGNELLFHTNIGKVKIGIYRKIGGAWTRIQTLQSPRGTIFGAEPVIYKGKSYIAAGIQPTAEDPDELGSGLAVLAPGSRMYLFDIAGQMAPLLASKTTLITRVDPETVVSNGKIFLYYYDINGRLYRSTITLP